MSDGVSVDWGRVQSIAQSAASSAANGVRSELSPRIRQVEAELDKLRHEMSQIANAIQQLSREMSSELKSIHSLNERQLAVGQEQLDAQKSSARTSNEILATNVAGFASSVMATNNTTAAATRNTDALVEVEYLRLYNEARAPLRFIEEFGHEINERFEKAIEGVHVNRELYDEHFRRIFDESDSKLRAIGEHIYRIIEEDFEPTVEQRLHVPRGTYQNLALEVDARRIDERSKLLDADLRELFDEVLAPLLEMHHRFESDLASRFAIKMDMDAQELLVPAAISVSDQGGCQLFVGCRAEGVPDCSDGVRFRLAEDERYAAMREAMARLADSGLQDGLKTRPSTDVERQQLLQALERLAEVGRIDHALLPGYEEYLRNYGLDFVVDGSLVRVDARPDASVTSPMTTHDGGAA